MTRSKHFDIWEWVDFIRGMGESGNAPAMRTHLSSGCRRCDRLVQVLRGFAESAPQEARYQPSPDIIRRAEAIFALHRSDEALLARLVYDSFREPLPAGMRAEDRVARHALFEAGAFFVDLQLEQEPSSRVVTLVGQISDREKPRANTTTLPVLLMGNKGLVASAMCNRLGEFEMQYKPARDLRLHVPVRETGAHVELKMDELGPPEGRRARTGRTRVARSRKPRNRTRQ